MKSFQAGVFRIWPDPSGMIGIAGKVCQRGGRTCCWGGYVAQPGPGRRTMIVFVPPPPAFRQQSPRMASAPDRIDEIDVRHVELLADLEQLENRIESVLAEHAGQSPAGR